MASVTCRYCGLPFQVSRAEPDRDHYCCTGCAILARIPVDGGGNFPVNPALVTALTLAFLYFNQLLAWLLSFLLAREGRGELSERFLWIAAGAAAFVWLAIQLIQLRAHVARGKDAAMAVFSLLVLAAAFRDAPPSGGLLAAGNAAALIWSFRGVVRRRITVENK